MVRKWSECNYAWIECRLFDSLERNEALLADMGKKDFVFDSSVFLLLFFSDVFWKID